MVEDSTLSLAGQFVAVPVGGLFKSFHLISKSPSAQYTFFLV